MIPSKHITLKADGEYITRVVAKNLDQVYVGRRGIPGYRIFYKSSKMRKGMELFVGVDNG